MRPAGKGEPAGGGRAKMRRSVLAFIAHFVRLSVCLCLASVVACGILYRLIPSVSSLVSSYSSRPIVSFPVCLFRFRHGASRSVVSFSPSRCASRRLTPLRLLPFSHSLRLVPVRLRLVPIRRHHCHHHRRRSCPVSVASVGVFVLVIRLSSSCVALASSAFPYCVPLDVPYETTRPRCPVNLFARTSPLDEHNGKQMEN